MARRMRLLDRTPLESVANFQASTKSSSYSGISSCLFLVDVIQSLHTGFPLSLSNRELTIHMPTSKHQFQDVYRILLHPGAAFPNNISRDDAVLLLFALLSEIICLRRSLAGFLPTKAIQSTPSAETSPRNPYIPLAVNTEYTRIDNRISHGLNKWATRFSSSVTPEVLALFHFCRLYRSCPSISRLPRLAGYKPYAELETAQPSLGEHIDESGISEDAIGPAWLVLDHATTKTGTTDYLSPIWLPVVLFYAGLVIWAKIKLGEERNERYGSLKLLLVFKVELEKLPWPCCREMAATLDRLMSK